MLPRNCVRSRINYGFRSIPAETQAITCTEPTRAVSNPLARYDQQKRFQAQTPNVLPSPPTRHVRTTCEKTLHSERTAATRQDGQRLPIVSRILVLAIIPIDRSCRSRARPDRGACVASGFVDRFPDQEKDLHVASIDASDLVLDDWVGCRLLRSSPSSTTVDMRQVTPF